MNNLPGIRADVTDEQYVQLRDEFWQTLDSFLLPLRSITRQEHESFGTSLLALDMPRHVSLLAREFYKYFPNSRQPIRRSRPRKDPLEIHNMLIGLYVPDLNPSPLDILNGPAPVEQLFENVRSNYRRLNLESAILFNMHCRWAVSFNNFCNVYSANRQPGTPTLYERCAEMDINDTDVRRHKWLANIYTRFPALGHLKISFRRFVDMKTDLDEFFSHPDNDHLSRIWIHGPHHY